MTLEYMYHHEEARLCYLSTCTIARRHYSDTLVHLQLLVDATVTLESRLGTFTTTSTLCLFDLINYVPSTIFQLNRDGSSWVEPVLG